MIHVASILGPGFGLDKLPRALGALLCASSVFSVSLWWGFAK
jgi:hypothetical protein